MTERERARECECQEGHDNNSASASDRMSEEKRARTIQKRPTCRAIAGADVNATSREGNTALTYAAYSGSLTLVTTLLSHVTDPLRRNMLGYVMFVRFCVCLCVCVFFVRMKSHPRAFLGAPSNKT